MTTIPVPPTSTPDPRHSRGNGSQRAVLSMAAALGSVILLPLLAFFAVQDRRAISDELTLLRSVGISNSTSISRIEASMAASDVSDREIRSDIAELKDGQKELNQKMDKILFELNRN